MRWLTRCSLSLPYGAFARHVVSLFLLFLGLSVIPGLAQRSRPASAVSAPSASVQEVNGNRALAHARAAVRFGPRPPNSPEIAALRKYIVSELAKAGVKSEEQRFTAQTPSGAVPMVNVIGKIPGTSGKRILLTGHYDTKQFSGFRFVGANDAGSSTGLLLELATVLAKTRQRDEIWIVFFDGEEAYRDWTETDSVYGSRYLAAYLKSRGQLAQIRALINVDMIGDRNLNLALEFNSDPKLREMVLEVAAAQGQRSVFDGFMSAIEDDHVPFARLGVPTLNLIDFSYGPGHAWWHSAGDTIDKLSPQSFSIVGNLVLGLVERLGRE